jgi:hypothetical protein
MEASGTPGALTERGGKQLGIQFTSRLKNNNLPPLSPLMEAFCSSEASFEMQYPWEWSHLQLSANTFREIS